jgi:hypothetical protein
MFDSMANMYRASLQLPTDYEATGGPLPRQPEYAEPETPSRFWSMASWLKRRARPHPGIPHLTPSKAMDSVSSATLPQMLP